MEIRGPGNNFDKPIGPDGPDKPEGAQGADKAGFKESTGIGKTDSPSGSQPAEGGGPLQPNFDRIASKIQEGLSNGQSKDQILEGVVDDHLTEHFGDKATPEMAAEITEKFNSDPQLSKIFSQLYNQVKGASS